MAHIITAVKGSDADLVKITTALLSVSDKTGLIELGKELSARGVNLLSTGGTAKTLRDAGIPCKDVSEHTGFPEILDGRVKSLHPRIHGGLLAVRGNDAHADEMAKNGIVPIDLVVCNLYAFAETVKKGGDFATCVENVDIGGPSMIRSAAKNSAAVTVASSPAQYASLIAELQKNDGCTSMKLRRAFAAEAFAHTANYDSQIASYFASQVAEPVAEKSEAVVVSRDYSLDLKLKYGCNPHQSPSWVGSVVGSRIPRPLGAAESNPGLVGTLPLSLPFSVLNGTPGYINLLDAVNAYQLARELHTATGLPGAASFKHVSPAGAAVAVPLSETLASVYDLEGGHEAASKLTPAAVAYLRSRQADPMCSYGDFAALSEVVDEQTAMILKPEVSDGIIAPGYTPKAIEILKAKKSGAFVILEAKADYKPPSMEYREVYGELMPIGTFNQTVLLLLSFFSFSLLSCFPLVLLQAWCSPSEGTTRPLPLTACKGSTSSLQPQAALSLPKPSAICLLLL
jgi:phosphoribosylaminoimidazolecarboxamide formyltransferase / IMP cyclohydrolase